jgi:hypothetical protein
MPSRKSLILFFLLVAVIYGMLLIPWPGLLSGYRAAVAGAGNFFLKRIGDGHVTFTPLETPTLNKDTEVSLRNIKTGTQAIMTINARRLYLPTAFTFALIVAAPISWRRKTLALVLGLLLISVYVGFGVWLELLKVLSEPRFGAVSIGPTLRNGMMVLMLILRKSPVVPYIAALVIFVLVTVRREDVVRLGSAALTARRGKLPMGEV